MFLYAAMMGRTYEVVQVSAFEQWHLQLYFLLVDYEDWTVLPAPISMPESIYCIGKVAFAWYATPAPSHSHSPPCVVADMPWHSIRKIVC